MDIKVGDVWTKKGCTDTTIAEICEDHMVVKWFGKAGWKSYCIDLEHFERCGWKLKERVGKPHPELKVGQVWKKEYYYDSTIVAIFEDHVVVHFFNENRNIPGAVTKPLDWFNDAELLEDVK